MSNTDNKKFELLKRLKLDKASEKLKLHDAGAAAAFVGAIAVLLLIGCYVISRLASDRAYREKWRDYHDCGWA